MMQGRFRCSRGLIAAAIAAVVGLGSYAAVALIDPFTTVAALHDPAGEHAEQDELVALVDSGNGEDAFHEAFEHGDKLFETQFNAIDGVGADVGNGERFTRVPRADLTAWSSQTPSRATGPNAAACNACHNNPGDDGSGSAVANVHRDPTHSGDLGKFIQRNTPHTFGLGALQRLAEEMTAELRAQRSAAATAACATGRRRTIGLRAKQIPFGSLTVTARSRRPCRVDFDLSGVRGVDSDLIVRPFQWKGSVAFLRDFNRGAAHNEIGMQPVELVGDGVDGDGDGVVDEMTVGDITALTVYLAAQPRPTSKLELNALGLLDPPLAASERDAIVRGQDAFRRAGCDTCHTPQLTIADPIFREPSADPDFRDAVFPAGQNPADRGVDPARAISFDLTADQPNNVVHDPSGHEVHLGSFPRDPRGAALVTLYGDLRRHDMGPGLAESIDETSSGASVFMTENLWGVGTTAPYLHDGRATTLTEAILLHGGEADASRRAFTQLGGAAQSDLIAFLGNLVLYKAPEDLALPGTPVPPP